MLRKLLNLSFGEFHSRSPPRSPRKDPLAGASYLNSGGNEEPDIQVSVSENELRRTLVKSGAGPVVRRGEEPNPEEDASGPGVRRLAGAEAAGKFTGRQLKRANTIIELVRQNRVIDDPSKLYKVIHENEAREGSEGRMDKKSLLRLLVQLSEEGQIKNIFMRLSHGDKVKRLHFVCSPDVDANHSVIQSAVEQAKIKFHCSGAYVKRESQASEMPGEEQEGVPAEFESDTVSESLRQMRREISAAAAAAAETKGGGGPKKPTPTFVRRFGLQPKFVRMRELHMLLFYLTRGYEGELRTDQDSAVEAVLSGCPAGASRADEALARELHGMDIYRVREGAAADWRTFIPPLPKHEAWSSGWCLMCDILLRIPLSLFVKLVNLPYEVDGLDALLAHPVRQHYLLRHLPVELRAKLLYKRKYIFTVHEVAQRLCYIGAIQFGPQKLKEKDQVFVYVNQRTSLVNTTGCAPGYHQLEVQEDVESKTTKYELLHLEDLVRFWYDMWKICMETPLGVLSSLPQQQQQQQGEVEEDLVVTLERTEKKPAMLVSLEPRKESEAARSDDASVPGDGRGAAGFDSSLFSHLKRNWSWNTRGGAKRKKDGATVVKAEEKPSFATPRYTHEQNMHLLIL